MIQRNKDIIYLLILSLIGVCFFIINAPEDFGDVGLSIYTTAVALEKAYQEGGNVLEHFSKYSDGTFKYHAFGHPFSVFAVHFWGKIIGLTPHALILLNIVIVFGTIFTAFYIGKIFYDSLFGFFFSLLLTVNVFYNVIFQTGAIYYSFCVPVALLSFLSFLRLHKNDEQTKRMTVAVAISALLFAVSMFHVYSHAVFGFVLSFLFLLILIITWVSTKIFKENKILNFDNRFRFLNIKFYLLLIILVGIFYFGLTSFWEKYNHIPLGTIADQSFKQFMGRSDTLPWDSRHNRLPWLINSALELIFVDVDKGHKFANYGVHSDTAITGAAVLNAVEILFFTIGIILCFVRRKILHLLCLSVIAFTMYLIVFKFNAHAPRIYFFIIPILVLIASIGLRETFNILGKKTAIFIAALSLFTIIGINFVKIYDYRVNDGGNKIWMNGLNRLYKFLEGNTDGNALVIFGTRDMATYVVLSDLLYVNNKFIKTSYYKEDLLPKTPAELSAWIRDILSVYDNIVFIFPADSYFMSNPGKIVGKFGTKHAYDVFLKATGYPVPSNIVASVKKVPLHYIYKFDKKWLDKKVIEVRTGETIPELDSVYKVENLYINGQINSISIKTGGNNWSKDFTFLTDGMDFAIRNSETEDGFIEYYPGPQMLVKASSNGTVAVEMDNFKVVENSGLTWLESKQPTNNLKYSFNFPYGMKITQAEIKTNPRIFNDYTLMNTLKASYSADNKAYKNLYDIQSNGNGRFSNNEGPLGGGDSQNYPFSGFNEYTTYNVIHPESNKLFLNFNFMNAFWSNNHVHLFTNKDSTSFKFTFDLKNYIGKIPLISNDSEVTFTGHGADTLYLTLSRDISYSDIQAKLTSRGYDFGDNIYTTLARFQKENGIKATRELDNRTFEAIRDIYYITNAKKRLSLQLNGPGDKNASQELIHNAPGGADQINIVYALKSDSSDKKKHTEFKDSFEKEAKGKFADIYISGVILDRSEEYAYDGKHSLMLGGDYNSGAVYTLNSDICRGLLNKEIEVGAWFKADVPDIANILLDVFYTDGSIEQVYSDFHPGDGKWRKLKVAKRLLKESVKVTISILNSSSNKDIIYIDLITMLADGKDINNYILDNSFENNIKEIGDGRKLVDVSVKEAFTEEIAEELPKYWNIGGDPFFVKKEDAVAYKNKASLKIYGNTPSPYANLALPVQPEYVATLKGKTLKFASYIKAKRAGIANLQMGITYADDTYSEIVSEFHPGDDQWHEIRLSKKFEKPVKNLTLNIFNRGTAEDYIYIDNAFCELNGKAVGKLIPNGDFEEWFEGSRYFTQKKSLKKHLYRQVIQDGGYKLFNKKVRFHDTVQSIDLDVSVNNLKPDESVMFDSYAYFGDLDVVQPLDFVLFFDEVVKPINMQRVLLDIGYAVSDEAGDFSGTKAALKKFQRSANLPETGLIDEPTLKALFSSP